MKNSRDNLYRLLIGFACFFLIAISEIIRHADNQYVALMTFKYVLVFIGALTLVISCFRFIHTRFIYWYYGYMSLLTYFSIYNAYLNHFALSQILAISFGFLCVTTTYQHLKLMMMYAVVFIALTILGLGFTPQLQISSKILTSLFLLAVGVVSVVITYFRLRAYHTYRRMALYDPLTGAHSRHYLERAIHALIKHQRVFALFAIDLDFFKQVNDTYGHAMGDRVLQTFALQIKDLFKDSILTRWGGDEFFLLVEDLSYEDCEIVCNTIKKKNIVVGDIVPMKMSVSVGYAIYPHDEITLDALVRKADMAMYRMKNGRETV